MLLSLSSLVCQGVDLSSVFCSVEAAIPIKSYAPDLMVRPCLFPAHMADRAVKESTAQKQQQDKDKTDRSEEKEGDIKSENS